MKIWLECGSCIDEVGFGLNFNWLEVDIKRHGIYRLGFNFLLWYANICWGANHD